MNVLFVGGGAGSWQVRGIQLAAALGGRCTSSPTSSDWLWADVVVLVKRAIDTWGKAAADSGVPVVWDVLDFWVQPDENQRTEAEFVADVHSRRDRYRVSKVIGATRAMANAIGGSYVPHHSRPGLKRGALRSRVEVVAYEGTPKYLGSWLQALEAACAARGWRFVVNPPTVIDADILVALRGEKWDGWVCREWKSGVKYVNAIAAGRPVIAQSTAACREIGPTGAIVEAVSELESALDIASGARMLAFDLAGIRAKEFALASVAGNYRALLEDVVRAAA